MSKFHSKTSSNDDDERLYIKNRKVGQYSKCLLTCSVNLLRLNIHFKNNLNLKIKQNLVLTPLLNFKNQNNKNSRKCLTFRKVQQMFNFVFSENTIIGAFALFAISGHEF